MGLLMFQISFRLSDWFLICFTEGRDVTACTFPPFFFLTLALRAECESEVASGGVEEKRGGMEAKRGRMETEI